MEVSLKENVYFITGYKNAAIYDNNNNKVYAVNEYGKNIIEKIVLGKEIKNKVEKEYLNNLEDLNLLSDSFVDLNKIIKRPNTKLRYAWLEITKICNLKCVHCYGQFGYPKIDDSRILTTEMWKKIIKELINSECKEIQLIGGEPMIHKDFYEILEYAHAQGMERIDVFTNGTLIDEKSIEIFKKTNAKVRVSLYGNTPYIHEEITKKKGSFMATEKALKLLKNNNIPTTIAVIIMRENEKYINEIKSYILNLGHRYNGYDVIRPTCINDGANHSIIDYNILKSRYNVKPNFYTNKNSFDMNYYYNSCFNGKIAITSNGDILNCIFDRDKIIGNLKLNTLKEIRREVLKSWQITKNDIDTCKDCEFRYCCHDCRPLAKAINGNYNSKYPRCCYNPYIGEWEKIEKITKEIN